MPIRRAALHPGSETPLDKGCGGATIGTVRVGGKDVPAVIKRLDPQRLAAEVFCACLARGLGFTTPEPLLVKTPDGIAFGSALVHYPSLVDHYPPHGGGVAWLAAVSRKLSNWGRHGLLLAFDDLIDNRDRNLGNLLVLADQGEYAPIDHAESLGLSSLPPRNKLALAFARCGDAELAEAAENAAIAASLTFRDGIGESEQADLSIHPEVAEFLQTFVDLLQSRRPGVVHRLAAVFRKPGQLF